MPLALARAATGYKTRADFEEVVAKHRQAHIPLDMVYMDIDYMDHFKDFTVNPEEFPTLPALWPA